MAEEEDKKDSAQEKEDNLEFKCTPCGLDNEVKRALHKCIDCAVLLCESCLEDHNRLSFLRYHQIVDEDAMRSQIKDPDAISPVPRRQCLQHPGKIVDMYCENHEQVCCPACVAIKHRTCEKVEYIPNVCASNVGDSDELKHMIVRAKDLKTALTQKRSEIDGDIRALGQEIEDILKELDTKEKKAVEEIAARFEKARAIVLERFSETKTGYDGIKSGVDSRLANVEKNFDQLEKIPEGNASEKFVDLMEGKKVLKDIEELQKNTKTDRLSLGLAVCKAGLETKDDQWPLVERKERTVMIRSLKNTMQWKVGHECSLLEMDNGAFFTYSFKHEKLELFDSSMNLISSLDVDDKPQAACQLGRNEVAVSFRKSEKIQYYTVGPTIVAGEFFIPAGAVMGLYYEEEEDNLYASVSDMMSNDESVLSSLNVYSKQGDLKKTIIRDSDGDQIFWEPRGIVMDKNKVLYVVDSRIEALVALDKEGKELWRYESRRLEGAFGITLVDTGNVIVTAKLVVMQIANEGRNVKILPVTDDYDNFPETTVCFCRRSNILITGGDGQFVDVFSVETHTI